MTRIPLTLSGVALALLISFAPQVSAAVVTKTAGVWVSSTGNTITIPPSKNDFTVYLVVKGGQTFNYPAKWAKGLGGKQFSFTTNDGNTFTCTANPSDKDQLFVQEREGGRKIVWHRSAASK